MTSGSRSPRVPRRGRWMAVALGLTALEAPAQAGGGAGLTVRYACEHGTRVQATYTGPHAQILVNGRVVEMDTASSGSGARYVGGGWTWWTKGPVTDLYRGEALSTIALLDTCRAR